MTDSLADRMKHWRSGEELTRTKLAWLEHIAREVAIAHAQAKAAKYAPRMVVVPLAGDRITR